MKAKTKLLVILSDIHVGSTVGLWPEEFVTTEGYPVRQNAFQKQLWTLWGEMREWMKTKVGKDPFEV